MALTYHQHRHQMIHYDYDGLANIKIQAKRMEKLVGKYYGLLTKPHGSNCTSILH